MPIPKEILEVSRPKGTVVKFVGGHYYVVKRTSRYDKGRRVPVDCGTVGKIVDFKFIPKVQKLNDGIVDVKEYGNIIFANRFGESILSTLYDSFEVSDAEKIYVFSMLKVVYGDITYRDFAMHYESSFLSELFPGIGCSRKTVGEFLELLGKHRNSLDRFMIKRIETLEKGGVVVVDGILKTCNSETNTMSEFSRKGRIKNSQDVSLLYAVNYKNGSPLASAVYPGNMLDKTSFTDFRRRFPLAEGVMVGDKGFELNDDDRKEIALSSGLKYLIPIKRNSKTIEKLKLQEYDGVVSTKERAVLCKKTKVKNDLFYYAFCDTQLGGSESQNFLLRGKEKESRKRTMAKLIEKYGKLKNSFGTIVFESNLDTTCDDAYRMYSYRWEIEEIFKYYKSVLDIDNVRVQSDFRLVGSEFINFIATAITCEIRNYMGENGLHKKYSYSQIMKYLSKVSKCRNITGPKEWHSCTCLKYIQDMANELKLDV